MNKIPLLLLSSMAAWKEALLREAARRFQDQRAETLSSVSNAPEGSIATTTKIMAPISPSPQALIEEVLRRISNERLPGCVDETMGRAEVTQEPGGSALIGPGSVIVDLGCGDGRWLLAAARVFQRYGVQCIGYDLDDVLLAKARESAATEGFLEQDRTRQGQVTVDIGGNAAADSPAAVLESSSAQPATMKVLQQDLMLADVSGARLVIAYLFREGCVAVQEKLETELPSSSAVVSVGFALRGWVSRWSCRVDGSVPCYFYMRPFR